MAQFFGEERSEFYAPFAEGFVTDLDAAVELHDSVECRVGRRKAISHYLLDRPPPVCQSQCHC